MWDMPPTGALAQSPRGGWRERTQYYIGIILAQRNRDILKMVLAHSNRPGAQPLPLLPYGGNYNKS
jgi:hypothetical protein